MGVVDEERAREEALIATCAPCPHCGGGTFTLSETPLNRAPRMDGSRSPIISGYLHHYCAKDNEDPFNTRSVMIRGRDAAGAVAYWNKGMSERRGP